MERPRVFTWVQALLNHRFGWKPTEKQPPAHPGALPTLLFGTPKCPAQDLSQYSQENVVVLSHGGMGIQKAVGDPVHSRSGRGPQSAPAALGASHPRSHTTHFLPLPSPPHHSLSLLISLQLLRGSQCLGGVGRGRLPTPPPHPQPAPHKLFTCGFWENLRAKAGSAGAARRRRVPRASAGYKVLKGATGTQAGRGMGGQWARAPRQGAPKEAQRAPSLRSFLLCKALQPWESGGGMASPETNCTFSHSDAPNSE